MCKDDKNFQILENIIFSKQPKTQFNKWYKTEEFNNYLNKLLPEISDCIKQEQKSVWHLYNVFEHTLIALKKANKLSKNYSYYEKQIILFSVFFHDMGKPYSLIEKVDENGKIYHGFPNHNLKSAQIFNRVKNNFNLCKRQCKLIENIILNHDTFNDEIRPIDQNLYNEKYKEIINFIDEKDCEFYFKSLVIVAKSDNYAQNRIKTKETLNKVIAFEKLINKS